MQNGRRLRYDVFLSYAREDDAIARQLSDALVRAGVTVWMDQSQLALGASFESTIQEAIESADAVVILVSNAAVQSEWVRREIFAAIASDAMSTRKLIVPVMVDDVEAPFFLRNYQWLDLRRGTDAERAATIIAEAIKRPPPRIPKDLELEKAARSLEKEEEALRAEMSSYAHYSKRRRGVVFALAVLTTFAAAAGTVLVIFVSQDAVQRPSLLLTVLSTLLGAALGFLLGMRGSRND